MEAALPAAGPVSSLQKLLLWFRDPVSVPRSPPAGPTAFCWKPRRWWGFGGSTWAELLGAFGGVSGRLALNSQGEVMDGGHLAQRLPPMAAFCGGESPEELPMAGRDERC